MKPVLATTTLLLLASTAQAEIKVVYMTPVDNQALEQAVPVKLQPSSLGLKQAAQLPGPSGWSEYELLLGIEPVKPWQKAVLAEPEIKPAGRLPAVAKFNQKVFSSKENTRGGTGIGGGGCGCN